MNLFRKVFVRGLGNHEVTAWRENAPKLSNIAIARLRDMLETAIGKNE
jgi:hypothetical protein